MKLPDLIRPDAVLFRLEARTRDEALDEIGSALARLPPKFDVAEVRRALRERERLGTTAVGNGVALPHARLAGVPSTRGLLALSERGIDFDAPDGAPVRIFLALVSPPTSGGVQLQALGAVSQRLADPSLGGALLAARDAREVYEIFVGPPPGIAPPP